jgi:hypothetical protein
MYTIQKGPITSWFTCIYAVYNLSTIQVRLRGFKHLEKRNAS